MRRVSFVFAQFYQEAQFLTIQTSEWVFGGILCEILSGWVFIKEKQHFKQYVLETAEPGSAAVII